MYENNYKSSAVAEMGDRLATINMGRIFLRGEGCAPFRGELGSHLAQCGRSRGLPVCQVSA